MEQERRSREAEETRKKKAQEDGVIAHPRYCPHCGQPKFLSSSSCNATVFPTIENATVPPVRKETI